MSQVLVQVTASKAQCPAFDTALGGGWVCGGKRKCVDDSRTRTLNNGHNIGTHNAKSTDQDPLVSGLLGELGGSPTLSAIS